MSFWGGHSSIHKRHFHHFPGNLLVQNQLIRNIFCLPSEGGQQPSGFLQTRSLFPFHVQLLLGPKHSSHSALAVVVAFSSVGLHLCPCVQDLPWSFREEDPKIPVGPAGHAHLLVPGPMRSTCWDTEPHISGQCLPPGHIF